MSDVVRHVDPVPLLFIMDLFESFGAELPAFTQMVVGMSEWMQSWWFILIIFIGGAIVGFSEAKKTLQKIP